MSVYVMDSRVVVVRGEVVVGGFFWEFYNIFNMVFIKRIFEF